MKTCRICLEDIDSKFQRCDCKDSLFHDECLRQWIIKKGNSKCEICLKNFRNIIIDYKIKSDAETNKIFLPLISSLNVIFMSLSFFILSNNGNRMNKADSTKQVNMLAFLMIILFGNISGSEQYKNRLLEIRDVKLLTL